MICPRCQTQNFPDAAFCDACGAPLEVICDACGEPNRREAQFCKKCGQRVNESRAATVRRGEKPATSDVQPPAHLAEKILASRSVLEGERKQVTVLFADIKGSTSLIERLDPEEVRKLLDPALEVMIAAVHRYEGTVNQVLGDGIMALFGAPVAHEDHALRACYAALEMQENMRRYSATALGSYQIKIGVGLNSGEVVVRSISNDLNMDYSAIGSATHLAARMEEMAAPGAILMTGLTLREVEGLVQIKPLGDLPVKGFSNTIETYELVGVTQLRKRLHAAVARGLSDFVGRDSEVEVFNRVLLQANAGHGQILALCGEPGLGKSRLVYEFTHRRLPEDWTVLEGTSASYGRATPYYPLIELLRRYFQIREKESDETIRTKVENDLTKLDGRLTDAIAPVLALLGALPDVKENGPVDDSVKSSASLKILQAIRKFHRMEPQQRRKATLDALKRIVIRESLKQPLILLMEDLHWIDGETQAFLDSLVESLPMARIVLLVNYRPGYNHIWSDKTYYTLLRVDPLPSKAADELLQCLLGNSDNLRALKELLISRTEGNPFFLEECVRSLVESGALAGARGAYRMVRNTRTINLPGTVQAVLADRIDRLPQAEKHLLQTASVIGVKVPLPLLSAVSNLPEEALYRCLSNLQSAEFLYETSLFPEVEYAFKHALTNEAVYGFLLQDQKKLIHGQIVGALEAMARDDPETYIETLARHALRGEAWEKAVVYSWQSGRKASARSANHEAQEFFQTALQALEHLPQSRANLQQAVDLRLELRNPLYFLSEFDELHRCLREAESIAQRISDDRRLGRVINFLNSYYGLMGEHHRSIEFGTRGLRINRDDVELNTVTHYYMGLAYHHVGQYDQSIASLRRALSVTQEERFKYERFGTAFVLSVICRIWLAQCSAQLGQFKDGKSLAEEAMTIAKEADHASSLAFAHISLGFIHLVQGNVDSAIRTLETCQKICDANNIQVLMPHIGSNLGYAYALAGRVDDAIPLMEKADEQSKLSGRKAAWALRLTWLGQASLLGRQIGKAREQAERAVALASDAGERGYEAWALKLLGDIALRKDSPAPEQPEQCYDRALGLAKELGMRPLEAHCHVGLGSLYVATDEKNVLMLNSPLLRSSMTLWV